MVSADTGGGAAAIDAIVFIAIAFGLYFLPLIVAVLRKAPNVGSVAVINFFLGWTLIGWVVALAMACRSIQPVRNVSSYGTHTHSPPTFRPPGSMTPPASAPPIAAGPPIAARPLTAGWYPDPLGRARVRYHDGTSWTDFVD